MEAANTENKKKEPKPKETPEVKASESEDLPADDDQPWDGVDI